MAKRYKLPEALGGGEYEGTREDETVGFTGIPGVGFTLWLHIDDVTEVEDPLPEEPPIGAVVRAFLPDEDDPWIFEHLSDGRWGTIGLTVDYEWAELCVRTEPVRLMFDPFAEPVELPWKRHGVEVCQTVSDEGPGQNVHASTKDASYGFAHLKPADAREMARALWSAADQAEAHHG